jgi:rhodanese-like protein
MEKGKVSIIIIVAIALCLVTFSYFIFIDKSFFNNNGYGDLELTANYTHISAHDLFDLIYNQNKDLILVDVPSIGDSRYYESHLESAILIHDKNHFPLGVKSLYNSSKDVVFYDDFDDLGDYFGVRYCKELINHTYGKIYYLDGGLTNWIEEGYPYWSEDS